MTRPEAIRYEKLPDGRANVYLCKDAEEVSMLDGENEIKMWKFKMKQFFTTKTKEEVENQFESLYLTAGLTEPTTKEILNTLSDAIDALSTRFDALEGGN